MTHKVSKITHLFALSLLLPLLAVFSSCGGEEPIEPQEPEEPMPEGVYYVEINPRGLSLHVGDREQLTAIIYPSDAVDQRVSWESDNPSVADVDENGYVTAYEVGSTIVRVKTHDGGHVAECHVDVLSTQIRDITLSDHSITMNIGDEHQLTAEISPSNATNKKLVWRSSNTSVATVSDGKVIAIGEGTTDIIVGTENRRNWDECTVTVMVPKIKFADDHAKSWCVDHFDTNYDFEISYDEAAAVQDLKNFRFDENITTFDEFQYFINVTSIPDKYFAGHGLESIILPKSIKSIGEKAFYQCSKLTKIGFSEGLKSIGEKAFYQCSKLTKIEFSEGLETIGEDAFSYCTGLTEVDFSEGLETIGEDAFSYCTGLTEVEFPKSLKTIGQGAFFHCEGLTKVEFSEGLETIGIGAFSCCEVLTRVELPKSLKTIGVNAFGSCMDLTRVYCKPLTPPVVLEHGFGDPIFNLYCRIYVPRNSIELYKVADGWKDFEIIGYDF